MFEKQIAKKEAKLNKANDKIQEMRKQVAALYNVRKDIEPWYEALNPREVKALDAKIEGLKKGIIKATKKSIKMQDDLDNTKQAQRAVEAYESVMKENKEDVEIVIDVEP